MVEKIRAIYRNEVGTIFLHIEETRNNGSWENSQFTIELVNLYYIESYAEVIEWNTPGIFVTFDMIE